MNGFLPFCFANYMEEAELTIGFESRRRDPYEVWEPRRGREYLDFCEQSEAKSLVTRDRILYPPLVVYFKKEKRMGQLRRIRVNKNAQLVTDQVFDQVESRIDQTLVAFHSLPITLYRDGPHLIVRFDVHKTTQLYFVIVGRPDSYFLLVTAVEFCKKIGKWEVKYSGTANIETTRENKRLVYTVSDYDLGNALNLAYASIAENLSHVTSMGFEDFRDKPLDGISPKQIEKRFPGLRIEILSQKKDPWTNSYSIHVFGYCDVVSQYMKEYLKEKKTAKKKVSHV